MQKALQKVFSLFIKTDPPRKGNMRKTRAQSLVEVAIAFPIFIMLFSGVVEFGFIINTYLSLLDATRDAARWGSGGDPFLADKVTSNTDLYYQTAFLVQKRLDPTLEDSNYQGRRIVLDTAVDDVIVSIYSADHIASGNRVQPLRNPYHLLPTRDAVPGNHPSLFTTQDILNTRVCAAPSAGVLVVEVQYTYHQVLGLPWMKAFDPMVLRAYTMMPIRGGEPVPPPVPIATQVCP